MRGPIFKILNKVGVDLMKLKLEGNQTETCPMTYSNIFIIVLSIVIIWVETKEQ